MFIRRLLISEILKENIPMRFPYDLLNLSPYYLFPFSLKVINALVGVHGQV